MLIKKAVYKVCGECKRTDGTVSPEVFGCDKCRKPLNDGAGLIEATVFRNPSDTCSERMQFCSWKCCIAKLRTVKCNYFINLPYLQYDEKRKGLRAVDFFAQFKK